MGKVRKFIVIEGPEAVGKTVQAEFLANWLATKKGVSVSTCRDPGSTKLGESLRKILRDPTMGLYRAPELFLYCAARAQMIMGVIRPALQKGEWVVSDRYSMSTRVYQGHLRPYYFRFIQAALKLCRINPGLCIVLHMPEQDILARRDKRGDRVNKIQHGIITSGYEKEAAMMARRDKNCVVVDATGTVFEVAGRIRDVVTERFPELGIDDAQA